MSLRAAEVIDRIVASKIAKRHDIQACSEEEIKAVETIYRLTLPRAYREFLSHMGRGAGQLMDDMEIYFSDCVCLTKKLHPMLFLAGMKLPEKAFVCAMREGVQSWFFVSDGLLDDPPIFRWIAGESEFERVSESFWSFVQSEVALLEEILRRRGRS